MGGFPSEVGLLIGSLKPGDQIIIPAGQGAPQVDADTPDIIWMVDGFSALTAGGNRLSCFSVDDLKVTGLHFDQYEVSGEAKKIQADVDMNQGLFGYSDGEVV